MPHSLIETRYTRVNLRTNENAFLLPTPDAANRNKRLEKKELNEAAVKKDGGKSSQSEKNESRKVDQDGGRSSMTRLIAEIGTQLYTVVNFCLSHW